MVLINKTTEIQTYNLDTVQIILNRIANILNTIPKYLYFPEGIPTLEKLKTSENVYVEDLLVIITNSDLDFQKLYEKLDGKTEQQTLDIYFDIFLPFISFNETLSNASTDVVGSFLIFLGDKLKDFEQLSTYCIKNLDDIYLQNKSKVILAINNGISSNKELVIRDLNFVRQLEKIDKGINFTGFELEKISIDFKLNISNISLMEVFNSIKLSREVPFASINNYFKILKDFIPLEDWSYNLPNIIIFKVLQKKEIYESSLDDYIDVYLTISEESQIIISLSLNIGKSYVPLNDLIEKRFMKSLSSIQNIEIIGSEQSGVNGVFYFPQRKMDRYIMSDLIMNNPIYSSFMSIDESDKATKKKGSLYVHFYSQDFGELAFNITEKVSIKNDANLKGKDIYELFKIGSNYIRIKISYADSLEIIEKFQLMLSKLFIIYDQNYEEIKEYYERFLPSLFTITSEVIIEQTKLKLKDIAPEVFVIGYPQKCLDKPTIISDDEVEDAEQQGKIVMRYPKEDEGFPQRNYICNNPVAKFPGLRENPLSNKYLVPFLPCCYKKNQTDKKGSVFRHYFYEEERMESKDNQQNFIKTNKFVQKDNFGALIGDINKIFEVFDIKHDFIYLRKGVSKTKNSFLECILEGLQDRILEIPDVEKEQYLQDIREEIGNNIKICNSGKQEMYDYTSKQINDYLLDFGEYLDPRLTLSILEKYFNCNIYVFNRFGFNSGKIVTPRHAEPFYRFKPTNTNRSIFIYEHLGSTSDHAKYPMCELIVKWEVGNSTGVETSFGNDSFIVSKIESLYFDMISSYTLNVKNKQIIFPLKIIDSMQQCFDSYGKTRMLKFNYKDQEATLLLSGIPSLTLNSCTNLLPTSISYDLALELIEEYEILIKGKTNNMIIGMSGNVEIKIPVIDISQTDDIPNIKIENYEFPKNNESSLRNYNNYKKLSRYIVEYSYWLYSKFLLDEDESKDVDKLLVKFVDEYIKIIPDYEYSDITKYFSLDCSLLQDRKLVVKSEETLKRLIYNLKVSLRNNNEKIKNYHNRDVIDNFYLEVSDFDKYPIQVILYGENSVAKWLHQEKSYNKMHDSVFLNTEKPYFFKNSLIGEEIYLVQNTYTLEKAKEIGKIWNIQKYNIGFNPEGITDKLEFIIYRYVNNKNIKMYKVRGESNSYNIKIIGYKVEENFAYSVLLSL
tara:strand:+ start:10092 stop:13634 length:3543 start_codon:yes stop_codon:yes gene_type:complete